MKSEARKFNILVIGTGMYVCGRNTEGFGTIFPALGEWEKKYPGNRIFLAGRSKEGMRQAKRKIDALKRRTGVGLNIEYFSLNKTDPKNYVKAIKAMPKPGCVIVAVPDHLHYAAASCAINHDMHALVVKPLTPALKEAKKLVKMQKIHGVYCAVEFHKRFDSANLKLKDTLESGSLGAPLYFLVEFSQRKLMPEKIFRRWAESTNIFQYLGIHYVDMIYFVTGAKPVRVSAIGQKDWLASMGIDTFDAVEAVIEWRLPDGKKFTSHILTNWIDPDSTSAMSDQKIKVIGTKGRYESDQKYRGITIVTGSKGIQDLNPYFCSPFGKDGSVSYSGYGIDSVCRFLSDVSDIEVGRVKISDLEGSRPTFRDAIIPTKVLEAANKSLTRNGEWVKVER